MVQSSWFKVQGKKLVVVLALSLIWLILAQAECIAATLTITASHGSVTVTPDKAQYDEGEIVQLIPKPETGYCFTGWQGDARGKSLVLNLTMDTDKNIIANFGAWTPPIGIPAPEFGIFETYRMYDVPANRNPSLTYYQNAEGGYYTHYVDNTHPNATDTSNPYGTASKPRRKLPSGDLPPGSVVEIHGGPYSYTDRIIIVVDGTADMPIFIWGEESRTEIQMEIIFMGRYAVLENIYMNNEKISVRILEALWEEEAHDHLSIRNCEIEGGGIYLHENSDYMVIYNNHIHHHGDCYANYDDDLCGVAAGYGGINYLWVVDNLIHNNGGDSVAAGHTAALTTTHLYIGRNVMYGDGENAVDLKDITDAIISENVMYDYPIRNPSSNGVITVTHAGYSVPEEYRGTRRAWFLFNVMYDAEDSANRSADTEDIYFIGNVIYDIEGYAFYTWDHDDVYFIGNTMYDVDEGIYVSSGSGGVVTIINNIFGSLNDSEDDHIDLAEGYINNAVVSNNLFQDVMVSNKACVNCIEADPLFVNPTNNDFHLQSASPAIDAGASSGVVQQVFDRFEQLYGIDIRKDIEGNLRTGAWDIGAYDYAPQGTVLYGDVSEDGEISAYDAALTAQAAVDLITLTPEQTKKADVSGDSEVSAYDAALIAQYSVGLIDKFPVE